MGLHQQRADEVGDQSYTFETLIPYFQKSINFKPPNYAKRGGPHSAYEASVYSLSGGPLHVSYWNNYFPVSQYFTKGLRSLVFKENGVIESRALLGFAQYPDAQIRDSSEPSFGQQAIRHTGMEIYQRTPPK